jgi:hypothetical protein
LEKRVLWTHRIVYMYTLNCCHRFYTNLVGVFVQFNTLQQIQFNKVTNWLLFNINKKGNELRYSSPINEISYVRNKQSRPCSLTPPGCLKYNQYATKMLGVYCVYVGYQ